MLIFDTSALQMQMDGSPIKPHIHYKNTYKRELSIIHKGVDNFFSFSLRKVCS